MSHHDLEKTLRDLQQLGTKLADEPGREIWQFEFNGRRHRLHFYPSRGRRATNEYRGLTALQRTGIAAPRAVALLSGFRLGHRLGDAVVIDRNDELIPLQQYLAGEHKDHRSVAIQLNGLVKKLGIAKLGHDSLVVNAFALDASANLHLLDGEHVTRKGLRLAQILRLHDSFACHATTGDIVRAWQTFGFGAEMPTTNQFSLQKWRRRLRQSLRGSNELFGPIKIGEWRGRFTRKLYASSSELPVTDAEFSEADWKGIWPALLSSIENDQLEILKRGDNGDVLRGEIFVRGTPLAIVVKRPRRKSTRQAVADAFRPSRARRTWTRTWKMIVRNIPCEKPLLIMEKRTLGYPIDSILVFGAIDGPTLADVDLDAMMPAARETIFLRAGRTLRQIERLGFTHMDAKSTNWIITRADTARPLPVLVDLDGVRHYRWTGAGIERLLRAMKQHPQYTPADSLSLCRGFAPRATLVQTDSE